MFRTGMEGVFFLFFYGRLRSQSFCNFKKLDTAKREGIIVALHLHFLVYPGGRMYKIKPVYKSWCIRGECLKHRLPVYKRRMSQNVLYTGSYTPALVQQSSPVPVRAGQGRFQLAGRPVQSYDYTLPRQTSFSVCQILKLN